MGKLRDLLLGKDHGTVHVISCPGNGATANDGTRETQPTEKTSDKEDVKYFLGLF